MAALLRPGLYLYLLPLVKQSRTVIWRGRGKDGISFLDRIPAPLIKSVHNGNQTIDLVNNSIIMVGGADNYDGLAGTNPLWTFLSEYQNMNPLAWELILRPILSENQGGACIFGTPRGHNHLYEMYQTNKENPDWFVSRMTVDDTRYEDGTPIITPEMIDQERRAGMPEELIQQEYYCSFEAAIQGAYFSEQMSTATKENRICTFEIDKNLPVHTAWDIGMRDSTSIGCYQSYPDGTLRCIYHMEDMGKHAEFWVLELRKLQERMGFKRWGLHFLPHDVRVNEWGGGRTRVEVLQSAGINPRIVRNHKIAERIQAIRSMFPRFWIHEGNCKHMIRAAQEYHADYDPKRGIYSTAPAHNWASHCMDQLGYFALGYCDTYDKAQYRNIQKYASFTP